MSARREPENVVIDAAGLADPRQRVMAVMDVARVISQTAGTDPADAIMMLLTAAAAISIAQRAEDHEAAARGLAEALGAAIVAARHWFPGPRSVHKAGHA